MSKNSPSGDKEGRSQSFRFDGYTIDTELRRVGVPIDITPKAFAVLRLLVERAGQLVTKQEIWDKVWPRVIVTDAALTMCVAEIRRVLGDDPRSPRFIATLAKRGYRFIGAVQADARDPNIESSSAAATRPMVGRFRELGVLSEAMADVRAERRRLIFIAGEPGIGKSTLLAAFKGEHTRQPDVIEIFGQCSERFGPCEPYLPLLEGLTQACRSPYGAMVKDHLLRLAPLWLAQIPSLVQREDAESLQHRVARATPERMLREFTEVVEALASCMPVVLCLEDLHWTDLATLGWLNHVARRTGPARLMVVATMRDMPTLHNNHPLLELLSELRMLPQCRIMTLGGLTVDSIGRYLEARLGGLLKTEDLTRVDPLARLLQERSGGNPLHLTGIVDEVFNDARDSDIALELEDAMASIRNGAMSSSLRQMILAQIDHLSHEEVALLEAASVAGDSLATTTVAAALELDEELCERRCERLARDTHLIQPSGAVEWPDGSVASRYLFRHNLYRELIYERIPAGRVARMHRHIARRLEQVHAKCADGVAGELAMHYARGRARDEAAHFSLAAGRNALSRAAYAEAEAHFSQGIDQLAHAASPPSSRSNACAYELHLALGQTLLAIRGWAAPAAEQAFAAAYRHANTGSSGDRFRPLWGMAMGAVVRADFARYDMLGRELMNQARESLNVLYTAGAQWVHAQHLFHIGNFPHSLERFELALSDFEAFDHEDQVRALGADFRVFTLSYLSHVHWCLGNIGKSIAASAEALSRAAETENAFSIVLSHAYAAMLHMLLGEADTAAHHADMTMERGGARGFEYYLGWGRFLKGRLGAGKPALDDADALMQDGMSTMLASGAHLRRAYYLALLAEQRAQSHRLECSRDALGAAFDEITRTHERCWQAELHRIAGLIYEKAPEGVASAESSYRAAIAVAREQQALSWELRKRPVKSSTGLRRAG